MRELTVLDLGRMAYRPALDLQERLVERVRTDEPDAAYLLLVEHDPAVITFGRRRRPEHILVSREQLDAAGIEVHETRRGGDVTYHGPGQLVGYLILNLRSAGLGVRAFVGKLEEALIGLLDGFGVQAGRVDGLTGVWAGGEKVAAIGTAVRRWVTYHGFALNVSTDLSSFDTIVPCGLRRKQATSLTALLRRDVSADEIRNPLAASVARTFGFDSVRRAECVLPVEAM